MSSNELKYSSNLKAVMSFVIETEYSIGYFPLTDNMVDIISHAVSVAFIASSVRASFLLFIYLCFYPCTLNQTLCPFKYSSVSFCVISAIIFSELHF